MVAHSGFGSAIQVDVAENATHAEHVLTFQVRPVAPTEYLHSQSVAAGTQIGGQVKFSHVVRALGVTYVLSVQVDEGCAVNASEVYECPACFPALG